MVFEEELITEQYAADEEQDQIVDLAREEIEKYQKSLEDLDGNDKEDHWRVINV